MTPSENSSVLQQLSLANCSCCLLDFAADRILMANYVFFPFEILLLSYITLLLNYPIR